MINRGAALIVVAALGIAGCSISGSDISRPPHSATPSVSASATPTVTPFARTPQRTAIGDPETLDVCAAIPLSVFTTSGERASYEPRQYPAGCYIDLVASDHNTQQLHVTINNNGDVDSPGETTAGTTRRTVAGLPVLTFASGAGDGTCEETVGHGQIDVDINVYEQGLSHARGCALVNAALPPLIARLRSSHFPALPVLANSLTSLDICKVSQTTLDSLPVKLRVLSGDSYTNLSGGCTLANNIAGARVTFTASLAVFFDRNDPPGRSVPVRVDGHNLYEITKIQITKTKAAPTCLYISVQGQLSSGAHEELESSSVNFFTSGVNTRPAVSFADSCALNRALLVTALTNAHLN